MLRVFFILFLVSMTIIWLAACGRNHAASEQTTVLSEFQAAELAGQLFCPAGSALSGKFCVSKGKALGPFPKVMRDRCVLQGGGEEACASDRFKAAFAASLRGNGPCPVGTVEQTNGLCAEGINAFGPFPVALVSACKAAGGGPSCETMRMDAKFAGNLLGRLNSGAFPMSYLARKDFGLRSDNFGDGRFGAARGGGTRVHAGIDVLLPIGTPVLAPCDGSAQAGNESGGFGLFVTVTCALPASLTDGSATVGEFLFGHLSSQGRSGRVAKGQEVGRSGDSGNARGTNPHIHTEFRITSGFAPSFSSGRDVFDAVVPSEDLSVSGFVAKLQAKCFSPTGLRTLGPVSRGALVDPFLVLACLSNDKPGLQKPTFQNAFVPWAAQYKARTFNVNEGQ